MHSYLIINASLIPSQIKSTSQTYAHSLFPLDYSFVLINGFDSNRNLVYPAVLDEWSRGDNELKEHLISTANEISKSDYELMRDDINSAWYVDVYGDG